MDIKDLEQAERFSRVFVTPLVEAVRNEIKPLNEGQLKLARRVAVLEKNQKRALFGLSTAAAVCSVVVGLALEWIKQKIKSGH